MKKNLLIILVAAAATGAVFAGCKSVVDDFGGEGQLRGRLLYADPYAGNGALLPLANRSVKLAVSPSDRLAFKYSTQTDKDGYFQFENLPGRSYDVFFSDTVRQRPLVALQTGLLPTAQSFELRAAYDSLAQNGLFVTVRDSRGDALGGARICVFNNATLARADTCAGSSFQLTTDAVGRAVAYSLPPGRYYLLSKTTLGGSRVRAFDSVTVAARGVARRQLLLNAYPSRRNGFELQVLDQRSTPLANSTVCVFNSAVLARVDTCVGSIQQLTTTVDGLAGAYNITPRKYYFRVRGTYGRLVLRGYDSLEVPAVGVPARLRIRLQ
jgi:hypothetical protein